MNFIKYADKYGECTLKQIYNRKELDELCKISKGSVTDLIDFLTISRNIILHFTNSLLSNNTELIKYTSTRKKHFPSKIHNALGITENLSLIPWNAFTDTMRIKFCAVILYHLLEDELNISDEYLMKYRNAQNLPLVEHKITHGSNIHNLLIYFHSIEFERTIAVIRNNIVKIPHYPSAAIEGFSHIIPKNQISTFSTSLDSFNTCCMDYCTFNTITAPLCFIPYCCWWTAMIGCCLYPLCYITEKSTEWGTHRCMSCLDSDVGRFICSNTLCYPCYLSKGRISRGHSPPEAKCWTIDDDKFVNLK